ncbi:MAG: BatA and WFA domain-containing protein [Clostridia bacterium]|nr:BatA and WFA domain-containing protein [Clostridia bacterium]
MSVGTWFGLLGLIAVPIVVLIYLIKSKYVPKTVSSTFIWQRSLRYMKRRVPINFIMSLLLIMQLLVVAAATLALIDIKVDPKENTGTVIIVDASASMQAKNGNKTRYDVAIEKLTQVAEGVDKNAGLVIIVAGEKAELLTNGYAPGTENDDDPEKTPYVYTKDEALNAISKLTGKCTDGDVDIDAALALARSSGALDKKPSTKVYLYTDKEFNEPPKGLEIVYCNEKEKDWNVSITSVADKLYASGYQFEVTINNQGTGFITKKAYVGQNRVLITEKMKESGKVTFEFTATSNYINPTYEYIFKINGQTDPCSITGKSIEKDFYYDLKENEKYELTIDLSTLEPGEYTLTAVEKVKNTTNDPDNEEYKLDLENSENLERNPTIFFLNLYLDNAIETREIEMASNTTKTFVFTARTGSTDDEKTQYFPIKSVESYTKARFSVDTGKNDIILEDNETYLGSDPVVHTNVLYVSNNIVLKNGLPDPSKKTTMQLILSAVGCQITSENIYHSSAVKRAPTSGYTLYIYEGVVPPIMPTDGTVWLLNAPKSPENLDLGISDNVKDAIVANQVSGYSISKSTQITGTNAEAIRKNVKFETIKLPGQDPITLVVGKYRVVGTVQEIEEPGMPPIVDVNYDLPDGWEAVYDATYYYKSKEVKTPIMLVGTMGTTKMIVTTFDFADSSMPVYITDFPVLIKNMISYSLPDVLGDRVYAMGDTLEFNPPAGADNIKYYYIPNTTLYDVYSDVLGNFKNALALAEAGNETGALEILESTLKMASSQIEGFPETSIRLSFKKNDKWISGEKLIKMFNSYIKEYESDLELMKKGKNPAGQSIKKLQVGSWADDGQELPTILLDKLGTYDIVVSFKQNNVVSGDTTNADTEIKPQTYTVTTFMPISERDINARGEKLQTELDYRGKDVDGNVINEELEQNSILRWVVLALIILLIIEWGVYYRDEY